MVRLKMAFYGEKKKPKPRSRLKRDLCLKNKFSQGMPSSTWQIVVLRTEPSFSSKAV